MDTGGKYIHLALAFDQNFITPFYVLLASAFENNKENRLSIHVIATGVSNEEKEQIKRYVLQNKSEVFFYDVAEETVKNFVILEKDRKWFTPAIFYRFYFPILISEGVKRLLYLDVDIVINGDLSGLFDLDMGDFPLAAVTDTGMETYNYGTEFLSKLGIADKKEYFNSGVLLINIDQWKQQQISEKAIDFLRSCPELITFPDQDALNVALKRNWYRLDKRYNFMKPAVPRHVGKKQLQAILDNVVIIHFTTRHKPWLTLGENRLRFLYHFYRRKSPRASEKKYIDFNWTPKQLMAYTKIRLVELFPEVLVAWRKIKQIRTTGSIF